MFFSLVRGAGAEGKVSGSWLPPPASVIRVGNRRSSPARIATRWHACSSDLPYPPAANGVRSRAPNRPFRAGKSIRSCGRRGPATLGVTVDRSNSRTAV